MPDSTNSNRVVRSLKAGGPPAVITAGLGVGATGIAGRGVETKTDPIATGVAQTLGTNPETGPLLLLGAAIVILVVALVVPGLFEDHHY